MVFHWNLIDNKSPQVPMTLLSILVILNNAAVWIVSTLPPTSKSSSPLNNPLVTEPKTLIVIGIIVIIMFHSVFRSHSKVEVHILLFSFFQFAGTAKFTILFYLIIIIIFFYSSEFFTSDLPDGFSLEFEWQHVSSSLQDSSRDSGRSQQCCHLDSLYPSANFQVLQAF